MSLEYLKQIDKIQTDLVIEWHQNDAKVDAIGFLGIVEKQHLQNFLLWHEEDKARAPDATDFQISNVKRSIDRLNQKRNDLIEIVDEGIMEMVKNEGFDFTENMLLNSETPGNMIDRCSIMTLKLYHMEEQIHRNDVDSAHLSDVEEKIRVLKLQRHDLFTCLYQLIDDIKHGRRRFKLYRQYKMYNDPNLNPSIYLSKK